MMWVPAQQLSVYYGSEITLVCVVEAHPEALTFWMVNGQMSQEVGGIVTEEISGPPKYKTTMKLKIPKVDHRHFATYTCTAKNPRGDTDGIIVLTERPSLTSPTTTSTTVTTTTTTKPFNKGQMYGSSLNEFENRHNKRKKDKHLYHYETTSSNNFSKYVLGYLLNFWFYYRIRGCTFVREQFTTSHGFDYHPFTGNYHQSLNKMFFFFCYYFSKCEDSLLHMSLLRCLIQGPHPVKQGSRNPDFQKIIEIRDEKLSLFVALFELS